MDRLSIQDYPQHLKCLFSHLLTYIKLVAKGNTGKVYKKIQ